MDFDPCKTYTPHGGAAEVWKCREPEVLFDGPAGTGKTRAVIEKAALAAMKYEGARILFVRKTRVSMNESVLVTMENKVLPEGFPVLTGASRSHRSSYVFPNRSEIALGGLDNVDRIMSAEYDMVCLFEATEATEDDWEKLLTRLRNGAMPYQQAIAECNPANPQHWLKARADRGGMRRIQSRHADNPFASPEYLARLANLTGHRRERLFLGLWGAPEGMVYDRFDRKRHVRERAGPWARTIIACDEGYTNPFACLRIREDGDGRLHVDGEAYVTRQLMTQKVEIVRQLADGAEAVVYDPSAADLGAELRDAGLDAVEADNAVYDGILRVQDRLEPQGDGRPRLTISPECENLLREFESYEWKEGKDAPKKENDHAMDALRYGCAYFADSGGLGLLWE